MKVSVDWIKDYVDVKGNSAEKIANDLTLAGLEAVIDSELSSKADTTFEMEITSNRPDWLSHVGVARELSAIYGKKLNRISTQLKKALPKSNKEYRIAIDDLKLCPYYSAVLLENIKDVKTPSVMKKRLEAVGLRSISFLVDVTNYVLLELGQPLHAFDADLIEGDTIYIRPARKGEKMVAIDDVEYELLSKDLVIADKKGPIAIAGVMGGKRTEVNSKTKNVLLESAFFNPSHVRVTSRRLTLVSESSYRFERKVDLKGVDVGRDRAVSLIQEHSQIEKISKVYKKGSAVVKQPKITLPSSYVQKVLGAEIKSTEIVRILKALGLDVKKVKEDYAVVVPSFRPDLLQPIDLVEEIASIYGYDSIEETLPSVPPMPLIEAPIFTFLDSVKQFAVSAGFQEVCNFSLVHEEQLLNIGWDKESLTCIVNPQHKDLSAMRPTLMQGLLENVKRNVHFGSSNLALFEVGHVYGKETAKKQPDENWSLGFALTGNRSSNWKDKPRDITLFDLKGVVESFLNILSIEGLSFVESKHPFLSDQVNLEVRVGQEIIGVIGQAKLDVQNQYDISQEVFLAELNLEPLFKKKKQAYKFSAISNFPHILRDLALLIPTDLKAQTVIDRVYEIAGALLVEIDVFDLFEGKSLPNGIKSLGITMKFQSNERTLSNEEINCIQDKILQDLNHQFGATLR